MESFRNPRIREGTAIKIKLLLIGCLLFLAPLSRENVEIKKIFNEIERLKQHFKTHKITVDGDIDCDDITAETTLLSKQPCARAYLSATQDDLANGLTFVQLDTESYDVSGDFDVATGSFTATIAGYYQVNGSIVIEDDNSLNDQSVVGVYIFKNSGAASANLTMASGSDPECASVSDIIYLSVGDTVSLYAYTTDAGIDLDASLYFTYLSIRLVQ